jgi:hypothetical protein
VLALRRGLDNAERTVPDRVCKVSIIVLSIPVGTHTLECPLRPLYARGEQLWRLVMTFLPP